MKFVLITSLNFMPCVDGVKRSSFHWSIEELRNTGGCSEKYLHKFLVHINFSSEYCSNYSRFPTPRLKNKNNSTWKNFSYFSEKKFVSYFMGWDISAPSSKRKKKQNLLIKHLIKTNSHILGWLLIKCKVKYLNNLGWLLI